MDLGKWLRSLGLERYEAVFRENAIDADVIRDLTEEHLRDLGVPIGARLKLLKAIAELRGDAALSGPAAGAPQPIAQAETAERRQVTVMFCDLVGSTALSARMDPEDLREVISSYQKCATETVQRFGGFVAKYMGDGVLVYFGYPQAHEDDAERAVCAGLELVPAVTALKLDTPPSEPCRHCNRAGRRWRPGRIGRGSRAWHCWRDAEPRGAAARHCRAEPGCYCRKHAKTAREPVRP